MLKRLLKVILKSNILSSYVVELQDKVKKIVLMLHEHECMAWEEISSESLVQGLSQCYVTYHLDGWKVLDEL